MNQAKPFGIWIRVSTEDQAKGENPNIMKSAPRFYAKSKRRKLKRLAILDQE